MQVRLEAIILRVVPYGDKSAVLHLFTREEGRQAFITSVSQKSKSGLRPSLLQILNQVEVICHPRKKGELRRIKELRLLQHYRELTFDPVKSCLAMFLAEVLQNLLYEEESQPSLFRYLQEGLLRLDDQQKQLANFHLIFMRDLSHFLGIAPERATAKPKVYFDLMDGHYADQMPRHGHYLSGEELALWNRLLAKKEAEVVGLNGNQRRRLTKAWLDYYRLHLHDFGELRSLPVLTEILH